MRRLRSGLIVSALTGVLVMMPLAQVSALGGAFDWVSPNYSGGTLNDQSNGAGRATQGLSADGRYALFVTGATDAVANDTNGYRDLFMHDRQTNTNTLVSVGTSGQQSNGDTFADAAMSADGRYVAFTTLATNFITNDYNGSPDIFVRDMQSGTTTRVCGPFYSGQGCGAVSMSADGRYVTYSMGDPFTYGGVMQYYRYDQTTGIRELASSSDQGVAANSNGSNWTRVSADGRYVVFDSLGTNLVANDTNGKLDSFRKDMQTGSIERISETTAGQSNGDSQWPSVSDDGRFVSFMSLATNLTSGAGTPSWRLYLKDMNTGSVQAVSGTPIGSGNGAVSGDGSKVMFETSAQLVPTDTDTAQDVYAWDRVNNTNRRLSEKADGTDLGVYGNGLGAVSTTGRYVVIGTNNMIDANDTVPAQDVYVYDAGPAAPTGLTAASPTKNKPVLNWTAVTGAVSYKVYRNGTLIATTSNTTFTDTAATDGTHTYKVAAVEGGVEGAPTSAVSVVYDTTRPVLAFTAPASFSGPFTTGPLVTVVASDSGSGLSNLVIHVYNSANQLLGTCGSATPAQLAAGSMSCDLASLPSGTYSVRSGSFDLAGNNRTINSGSFVIQ